MITGELKNKIDGIWDIFWSSGMTNPLTVIEQITYLMFIKILDDNELRKEANAAAFDMPVVDPVFDAEHQNCRWHNFRHYEAETMFRNMNEKVFPFIKNELNAGKDTAFAKYMKDALFLVPTARVLVRVVDALDSGKLYAVGADVFAAEPCGKDHLLAAHPRCVATPHVAWSPEETRARVIQIAADDVQAFLNGEKRNVVN